MYERFTDRRKVMGIATEEAPHRGHGYVGTEHLLLGVVIEGSGVAANALRNLHHRPTKIRRRIERIIAADVGPAQANEPAMTPRVKNVMAHAMAECRELNHHDIGTEHLLLGMIRERDSFAGVMLEQLGLELDPVRTAIQRLLGFTPESP